MATIDQWQNLAKHKANEILEEVSSVLLLKPPIPIKDVIDSYLGDVNIVSVLDYNFPKDVSAFSQRDPYIGWLIVVNGKECLERRRFSVAHELAHIVLFINSPKEVFCSNSKNWDEKICDRFAGDILMPEAMVRELYKDDPKPCLETIARTFKVSRQVAEIQLGHLGLPFRRLLQRA